MSNWSNIISNELEKSYMKELSTYLTYQRTRKKIYPPKDKVFNCFNQCEYNNLKVVLLGQDWLFFVYL